MFNTDLMKASLQLSASDDELSTYPSGVRSFPNLYTRVSALSAMPNSRMTGSLAGNNRALEQQNIVLQSRISTLVKRCDRLEMALENNAPHKQLFRFTLVCFAFFSGCFASHAFLSLTIIVPFWNTLFLALVFGFWIMALVLERDYRTLRVKSQRHGKVKKGLGDIGRVFISRPSVS